MGFLKTVTPGEGDAGVEKLYNKFLERAGMVPQPMVMFSASPGLMAAMEPMMDHYREASGLSPMLATLIRYLTAYVLDMPSCVEFNALVLEKMGVPAGQVEAIVDNPANAPVEEREGWMLAFVLMALRDPARITESHIENLRARGWSDAAICDALYLSARMIGVSTMLRALGFNRAEEE